MGFAALSAAFYAYVPLRAFSDPAYSELTKPVGWGSIYRYVTAQEFQGNFGFYSLEDAVLQRIPEPVRELQKQWMWPVLALVPFGMRQIRARSQTFFVFLLLALAGLALFAVGYEIPDPDGFYLPIVTLLALPIGASVRSYLRIGCGGLGSSQASPRAWSQWRWRTFEAEQPDWARGRLQDGQGEPLILWDLDDLFTRVPEGALLRSRAVTMAASRCSTTIRFADPVPARRKVGFILLPGIGSDYFRLSRAMEKLGFERARDSVICSIRPQDAEEMRHTGASVRTLERPSRDNCRTSLRGRPDLLLYAAAKIAAWSALASVGAVIPARCAAAGYLVPKILSPASPSPGMM